MSQLVRLEGKHSTQNAHCAMATVNRNLQVGDRKYRAARSPPRLHHRPLCAWEPCLLGRTAILVNFHPFRHHCRFIVTTITNTKIKNSLSTDCAWYNHQMVCLSYDQQQYVNIMQIIKNSGWPRKTGGGRGIIVQDVRAGTRFKSWGGAKQSTTTNKSIWMSKV